MPKPKSHARLSRIMQNLRPGDAITNLDCPVHRNHRILVLASCGGTWFDFSVKSVGALSIVRDTKGPWRWDDHAEAFVNHDGRQYGHVGPETIVQQGAGIEQLQWYRDLPAPEADRWYIDPDDLIGTAGDPGTIAKLEALLARPDEGDGRQQIRNTSHVLEMILGGTGALDARRMRLLHVLINSCVGMVQQSRASQGRRSSLPPGMPPELAALFGAEEEDGLPEGMPPGLGILLAAALAGRSRRTGSGRERDPRSRGNGHDHGHPAMHDGG